MKDEVEPADMARPPVMTTIWPDTPWNSSWSQAMYDPVNYILIGFPIWLVGVVVSFLELGPTITITATGATIISAYGAIFTVIGFILTGAGSSLFGQQYIKTRTVQLFSIRDLSIERYDDIVFSLIRGVLLVGFFSVTILSIYESVEALQRNIWWMAGLFILTQINLGTVDSEKE